MKGRIPKTVEERRMEGGSTVSHRPIPPAVLVSGKLATAPEAPASLNAIAAEVWDELSPQLVDANMLAASDLLLLEALCVAVGRAREAAELIQQNGLYYVTQRGHSTVHPAVKLERDSWAQATTIAQHFGLSPLGRVRLGLAVQQGRKLQQELADL